MDSKVIVRPAYGSSGKHICCVKKMKSSDTCMFDTKCRCLQLDLRPRLTDSFSCCSCLECWAFAWSPVNPDRGGGGEATSPCTPELPPPYLARLARRCRGAPGGGPIAVQILPVMYYLNHIVQTTWESLSHPNRGISSEVLSLAAQLLCWWFCFLFFSFLG